MPKRWARADRVGYLPDMFGHIAQMPQILRQRVSHQQSCGKASASIDRHAFFWRSPDGSLVNAGYLVGGYGNSMPVRHPGAARLSSASTAA